MYTEMCIDMSHRHVYWTCHGRPRLAAIDARRGGFTCRELSKAEGQGQGTFCELPRLPLCRTAPCRRRIANGNHATMPHHPCRASDWRVCLRRERGPRHGPTARGCGRLLRLLGLAEDDLKAARREAGARADGSHACVALAACWSAVFAERRDTDRRSATRRCG